MPMKQVAMIEQALQEQTEQVDVCADVDLDKIEQVANQVTDHIVNIDLTTYQFDVENLVEQAKQLGLDPSEFEFDYQSRKTMLNTAKCILKNQEDLKDRLRVSWIWNLIPLKWCCIVGPIIECALDCAICPFCWLYIPIDRIFCVWPWNGVCYSFCVTCVTGCYLLIVSPIVQGIFGLE